MKCLLQFLKPLALVVAIAAVAFATDAFAKGGGGCPRDIECPMVWDPVTCSNGVTYSNACMAFRDCATGCTGGGAGA